uniref:Epithelial cell transforming sequence 2 oncogene-like n=1 Tax=Nothobranchius kadleci TaxID=1051664 RepID=A0A1A8CR77_NOTKA
MATAPFSAPHSVKLWQLNGTDYQPQRGLGVRTETRFSTWTPLNHQQSNLQLFEERVTLVQRWFDLWTDSQRKHLLDSLFSRCSKSQLKSSRLSCLGFYPSTSCPSCPLWTSAARLNRIPAYELVLSGVKAGVTVVLYDHRGTLPALLLQPHHPDHAHLSSALNTMQELRLFIQKLKRNLEADRLLEETQQMVLGCPSLREGSRRLVITQEATLLRCPDGQIPDSLKIYEQVGDVCLFLFNDALMLTRRNVHHTPFTVSHRSTHTFLASVALTSLSIREITHTRYVHHAFILESPSRSWVCATERGGERECFLSALRLAVKSVLRGHQ